MNSNALNKCYVLPTGDCISPFDCVHGKGLSLAEFLEYATADRPSPAPSSGGWRDAVCGLQVTSAETCGLRAFHDGPCEQRKNLTTSSTGNGLGGTLDVEELAYQCWRRFNNHGWLGESEEIYRREWPVINADWWRAQATGIARAAVDAALASQERDARRLDWLENNLVYAIVRLQGYNSQSLPNNGRGWMNGELREAIDKQLSKENPE